MLKLLLRRQISEIFRNYFYDAKKNRARSRAGIIGYMALFLLLMVGMLGGMFTFLSVTLCEPLHAAGMDWLYFVILGMLSILLGTFGSVFNTYSTLYMAKDNDLMLSMPIPVQLLMAARLLTVYLLGLMYSAVVILPAVIVYWIAASASAGAILGGLLLVLLISVFVLTLSCALGWVVARISMKLRNKSFITVVVSLAFIIGYYFFYFQAQTLIQSLLANAAEYGAKIKGAAYPLFLFGQVGTGDPMAMLAVSAAVFALFGLVWWLISRSFLRIATSSGKVARRAYRETAVKQRSISSALLGKEFSHFLASPNYMLNCGLGVLLMPICGVLLLWKGGMVISVLNEIFGERASCTPLILCAAVCTMASMNDTAAPSVSLEGRSLWLAQSLPVKPWQVLRAKLGMQLLLTAVPAAFCLVCMAIVYPYTAAELLLTALLMAAYVFFSALLSLFLGVTMPNLTWTNEITPIKQSASAAIAIFSGFGYTLLLVLGYMLLSGWKLGFVGYMSLFAGVTLAVCAGLWYWLRHQGSKRFAAL